MAYTPLRVRAKHAAKKILPARAFGQLRSLWIASGARFVGDKEITQKYTDFFLSRYPRVVQAGPFTGMAYVDGAVGSTYLLKLIGSYEAILHPLIESLREEDFDTIIDIGSAEGYYLAGLGRMFPRAALVGFETDEQGRKLNQELYSINAMHNDLTLLGTATNNLVAPYVRGKTLLVCDCEGAELDILTPDMHAAFKAVDTAIIELHDFLRPGIKEALTKRFSPTHTITVVQFALADPDAFPFFASVKNKKDLYELRRERGCQEQEWMLLKIKK